MQNKTIKPILLSNDIFKIANEAPTAIAIVSDDGRFIYVNSIYESLHLIPLGWSKETALGELVETVFQLDNLGKAYNYHTLQVLQEHKTWKGIEPAWNGKLLFVVKSLHTLSDGSRVVRVECNELTEIFTIYDNHMFRGAV